jgi:SAM-dependent methyltransferase
VAPSPSVAPYVTRTVTSRFRGRALQLQLSHALFSSFDVDDGSRLLLKSIAGAVPFDSLRRVVDLGCGTGVLGLSVATSAPGASVLLRDRDALAAAFAASNAALNGITNVTAEPGLGFEGLALGSFDLVLSNLPAKAGAPVLKSFFSGAASMLTADGRACFVIVATLDGLARDAATEAGLAIAWEEKAPRYTVFHLVRAADRATSQQPRADLAPYVRAHAEFASGTTRWLAHTVYGLPDFDTLGLSLEPLFGVLDDVAPGSRVLVMNPGQGHPALFLVARHGARIGSIALAARDTLSLAIAARNLSDVARAPLLCVPVAGEGFLPSALPGQAFDLLVAVPVVVPKAPWQPGLLSAAQELLVPGGTLVATGSSTEIQRLLASHDGFSAGASRRHAGFRAAALVRR